MLNPAHAELVLFCEALRMLTRIARVLHGWLHVQIPVPQEGCGLHLCSLQSQMSPARVSVQAGSYGNN